jgi:hypothetical protein
MCPVIMVETPATRGILRSLRRSWELSAGHWGYILCVMGLVFIFKVIVRLMLDGLVILLLGDDLTTTREYLMVPLNLFYETVMVTLGAMYVSSAVGLHCFTVLSLATRIVCDDNTVYRPSCILESALPRKA